MLSAYTCRIYTRCLNPLRTLLLAQAILFFFFVLINPAYAGQAVLAWDATSDSALTGYMFYYGQSTGSYTAKADIGKVTAYTVGGLLEGKTYYFAVTAYDSSRDESGYSNEVTRTIPYSAPTANSTVSPTSGIAPLSVDFTSTSSGTITGYLWNFGDGSTGATASPTHSYAAAGSYSVALTVTGPGGSNTQTKANVITVSAQSPSPSPGSTAPVAGFTANATSGPAPLSVNFTSTSTGSINAYAWTFGDGTTSTAQSPSHTYTSAGIYTVTLQVSGTAGSNTQTKTGYITATTVPTTRQGLVAAYSFDEGTGSTVSDQSGNNNVGTISGATWATGRFGKALSFNGSNSRVTVKDAPPLDLTGGMTLEAWIYPTATMTGWRTIVLKEQPGQICYYLYANTDAKQPSTGVFIGSERAVYGGTQLPINAWTHLSATYDGSMHRLYINGVQVASRAQTGAMQTSGNPLNIGSNSVWGEYFQGLIDEVRIYNRALSVSEIQADMGTAIGLSTQPTPTPTPTPTIPTGLVAAYSFDEGTGATVSDRSGNGNNGTVNSATWTTGRFGKALLFNGTSSRVSVSDSPSLDLSTGMTLEAWVYPTAAMTGWRTIVLKEQPGQATYYLYANTYNNQPSTGVYIGSERALYGGTQLPVNAWTHLAATYDGSAQRLYVNGVEFASRAQTGSILTSGSPLRIGSNRIWGEYFQGAIDEVRIYNRALSVSEIQADMGRAIGATQ